MSSYLLINIKHSININFENWQILDTVNVLHRLLLTNIFAFLIADKLKRLMSILREVFTLFEVIK